MLFEGDPQESEKSGKMCGNSLGKAPKKKRPSIQRQRIYFFRVGQKIFIHLRGRSHAGNLRVVASATGRDREWADAALTAQFPGKVREVGVSEGQAVTVGQSLCVIEAMKMDFVIKSPTAGVIAKVLVQPGQQIMPGHRYVEFRPTEEGT